MIQAVSYLRCSGDGQVSGDTWSRQRAACEKYAQANNLEILREFRDEGVPGKTELEGRAGLSDCLEYVRQNPAAIVLVESSDRLARDVIVAEVCIREFQRLGVRVIAASGGIDLTEGNDANPTAKLVRQILAAVAEFDRCVIVLKTRAARQRVRMRDGESRGFAGEEAVAKGRCEGRKPYGDKPGEGAVLARMRRMQEAGMTMRKITERLNSEGFRGRSGKPWHLATVHKILNR